MSFFVALLLLAPFFGPVLWGWGTDATSSADYGHILPLSLALIALGAWRARKPDALAPGGPELRSRDWALPLGLACLLGLVGLLAAELTLQRAAAVLLFYALIVAFFWPRASAWRGPILAHFLLIPWPYVVYYGLTARLQVMSSMIAATVLKMLGIPLARDGNLIHLPGYDLEIVQACSGMRSVLALTALAAAIIVWHRCGLRRAAELIFTAIPLALLMNLLRLVAAGITARLAGPASAGGWMHDAEGLVSFTVGAMVLSKLAMRGRAETRVERAEEGATCD